MTSRQIGHLFFEPKGYDVVNQATHEYKEAIKVGYNLRRKIVLLTIWALSPLLLFVDPTLFGTVSRTPNPERVRAARRLAVARALGLGGLLFRTVHLFFIRDVQTGLVWATKILTDPFHDIKLYYRAPAHLLRGEFFEGANRSHIDTVMACASDGPGRAPRAPNSWPASREAPAA